MADDLKLAGVKSKKPSNTRKKIILGSASAAIIAVAVALGFTVFSPASIEARKAEKAEYAATQKVFKKAGIDYSYEDFKHDKAILDKEGKQSSGKNGSGSSQSGISGSSSSSKDSFKPAEDLSDSYKELHGKNDDEMNDISNQVGFEMSAGEIKQIILKKDQAMSDFVHKDKFGLGKYEGAYQYCLRVYDYIRTGKPFDNAYGNRITVKQQVNALKSAIYNQEPFTVTERNDDFIGLNGFIKRGCPKFTSIYGMDLSEANKDFGDGLYANLKADITTNNGNYEVYLYSYNDGTTKTFKVVDII